MLNQVFSSRAIAGISAGNVIRSNESLNTTSALAFDLSDRFDFTVKLMKKVALGYMSNGRPLV
jgi:hypothetical protein